MEFEDLLSLLFLSIIESRYFVAQSNNLIKQPLQQANLNQNQIENNLVGKLCSYFGIEEKEQVQLDFTNPEWVQKFVVTDVGIFSERIQRKVIVLVLQRMHNIGFVMLDKPRYIAFALLWRLGASFIQGCFRLFVQFCWRMLSFGIWSKNKKMIKYNRFSEFLESETIESKRLVMKLICADRDAQKLPNDMRKEESSTGENWMDSQLLRFLHFIVADACSLQRVWKMDSVEKNFGYGLGNVASKQCVETSEIILERLESLADIAHMLPNQLPEDLLRCWIQCCNVVHNQSPKLRKATEITNIKDVEVLNGIAVILYTSYYSIDKDTTFLAVPELDQDSKLATGFGKFMKEALNSSRAPIFPLQQMEDFKIKCKAFSKGIIYDDYSVDSNVIRKIHESYIEHVKRLKALIAVIIESRSHQKGVSLMLGVALSANKTKVFIGVTEKYRANSVELLIWLAMAYTNVIPVWNIDDSNKIMHTWILNRVAELVFTPEAVIEKLPEKERDEFHMMVSNLHKSIKQAWFWRFHRDCITITKTALGKEKTNEEVDSLIEARRNCINAFVRAQKKLNDASNDYSNPPQLSSSELSALFVWFDREAICLEPLLTPQSKCLDLVCIQFGRTGEHAHTAIGKRMRAKPCTRYCSLFSSTLVIWSRLVEGVTRNSLRDNFGQD